MSDDIRDMISARQSRWANMNVSGTPVQKADPRVHLAMASTGEWKAPKDENGDYIPDTDELKIAADRSNDWNRIRNTDGRMNLVMPENKEAYAQSGDLGAWTHAQYTSNLNLPHNLGGLDINGTGAMEAQTMKPHGKDLTGEKIQSGAERAAHDVDPEIAENMRELDNDWYFTRAGLTEDEARDEGVEWKWKWANSKLLQQTDDLQQQADDVRARAAQRQKILDGTPQKKDSIAEWRKKQPPKNKTFDLIDGSGAPPGVIGGGTESSSFRESASIRDMIGQRRADLGQE